MGTYDAGWHAYEQVMKKNNLHFEKDGYLCLIYPEQKLDIAS